MSELDFKEVRFDIYCETCKYGDRVEKYETEEIIPCCDCLETGVREGTMVPTEWEEK